MTSNDIYKQAEDHRTGKKPSYNWRIRRIAIDIQEELNEEAEKQRAKTYVHDESISQAFLNEKLNGSNGKH